MSDVNKLWAHVTRLDESNLFAQYPRILQEVMEAAKLSTSAANYDLLLPSNPAWREQAYFKLVKKQREINIMPNPRKYMESLTLKPPPSPWDTRIPKEPVKNAKCVPYNDPEPSASNFMNSVSSLIAPPITWNVDDITKAASLLIQPPLEVEFVNEHEMRKVYSLIYDVFRYKNVLNQALIDVTFFRIYPDYKNNLHVTWLLLYELYCRRFRERSPVDREECKKQWCNRQLLFEIETALWELHVKLAAAVSRIRIAHSALHLNDMLPPHLRDERVHKNTQRQPLTAWVNKHKVHSPVNIMIELNNLLNFVPIDHGKTIIPSKYTWDTLCPMILCFHQTDRDVLSKCQPVQDHKIIIQDRSFSYGPAMFCKILFDMELYGSVVMTHVTSPRTVAYFATLLSQNDNVYSLLAFGAGERKFEFDQYMSVVGVDNILIYAKKFQEMDMNADILENVIAVLATPPNSHSAVADPVDLVCGRGGDLLLLELLTDDGHSHGGEKRVSAMLEEQRSTLALAMSRPQIQFILYETHSQLPEENEEMINHVMRDVNNAARRVHAKLEPAPLPRYARPTKEVNNNEPLDKKITNKLEINNNEINDQTSMDISQNESYLESDESTDEKSYASVELPVVDEFELASLPDLCFNSDSCLKLKEDGCYLGFIRRKQVINLNSKFMIKTAEERGLFGANMGENSQRKTQKTPRSRKKTASAKHKKRVTFEVERIAAQTHASLMRSYDPNKSEKTNACAICPRHKEALTELSDATQKSPAKQWWAETTRYLTRLKKSLIKQKIVTNRPSILRKLLPDDDDVLKDIHNIDEILARVPKISGTTANIPVFPKLRLTRPKERLERIPFPIYNCCVELPERQYH